MSIEIEEECASSTDSEQAASQVGDEDVARRLKLAALWQKAKRASGSVSPPDTIRPPLSGSVSPPDTTRPPLSYMFPTPLDRAVIWKEREEAAAAAEAKAAHETSFKALKAYLLTRRRLRLDPEKHLHFLYDPGKHASSAITIKNISRTHVAFKFQTNVPKSCIMRPNGGILAPNESIIGTVVKHIEQIKEEQEKKTKDKERKTKEKLKIVSLVVKPDIEYYPQLFDEQWDTVFEERLLRVVYIDPNKASPELVKKLQRRLAEAEAAEAARKKPEPDPEEEEIPKIAPVQEGQGLVINEWKKKREAFLAQQQAGGKEPL